MKAAFRQNTRPHARRHLSCKRKSHHLQDPEQFDVLHIAFEVQTPAPTVPCDQTLHSLRNGFFVSDGFSPPFFPRPPRKPSTNGIALSMISGRKSSTPTFLPDAIF